MPDYDPTRMFTADEIYLEEQRMARERYRARAVIAGVFALGAVIGAANLYMFAIFADALWPVWVDAVAVFPLSPRFHWNYILVMHGVMVAGGIVGTIYHWRKRHPPNDLDWTEMAVRRLTFRGGLYGGDDG